EFPPKSKLNPEVYGNQTSTITKDQIERKARRTNSRRDHHDMLMPYLRRINTNTSTKAYGARTLLFLKDDGNLKPLAIELSLPHPDGDQYGAASKVFTPSEHGVESSIWWLAKAYASVNDAGVHQIFSHWLHTHAVMEPIIIAANRQLIVLHPIYKLLHPHFRDTMNINAFGRQILVNAGGVTEKTVFPQKYSMEMSAMVYKDWKLTEHGLPADLIKRGMAVPDPNCKHGLRFMIEDYPFAVDGLEIWLAIEKWVEDYCSFYYPTDDLVQEDSELQAFWKEVRGVGHDDKKDEPWWPKMQTLEDLTKTCTIIIWVASALHAALNFGQYNYAGFMPDRPTISRRFMPEPGSAEVESDPEKAFLRTIPSQKSTLLGIGILEIASRHAADEVYLGQRDTPDWTTDVVPLEAFNKFGKSLEEIEKRITERNNDENVKNRVGPVKIPYTLLYPTSEEGPTGKGIPNSVS
ncbi:Lipoxygenase, C-terminal, partial [Dillenia turbinata]